MGAVCRLIKVVARLPGMKPPLQLYMLIAAVHDLCKYGAGQLSAPACTGCRARLGACLQPNGLPAAAVPL